MTAAIDKLTPHQQRIAMLVCTGLTDAQIGAKLGITRDTVTTTISRIHQRVPDLALLRNRSLIWRAVFQGGER